MGFGFRVLGFLGITGGLGLERSESFVLEGFVGFRVYELELRRATV